MKRRPPESRKTAVRRFITDHVRAGSPHLTERVKDEFKISRQAAFRYVQGMVKEGYLDASGRTHDRVYRLGVKRSLDLTFTLDGKLGEEAVWTRHFSVLFQGLKDNIAGICEYGLTEMVNNAIDHSEGASLRVKADVEPGGVSILVGDDGVGIFRKIQREMKLDDPRHSLLELAKGKYTTDPARHTGEGIFFTSKMFDKFLIRSGGLSFSHGATRKYDSSALEEAGKKGTHVLMVLDPRTRRTAKSVFDGYTERDRGFGRTVVPVELAKFEGGGLISRSQGKRLVARLERFHNVVLDFRKVATIGRPFADEVFRVFAGRHRNTRLTCIHTTKDIDDTIRSIRNNPS